MSRHVHVAAVTLDDAGGGIAAASRLMWHAVGDRWGHEARLVTLAKNGDEPAGTSARIRFGTALASAQVRGQVDWIVYTHLALAKVQRFVPPPFRRPYAIFLHGIEAWRPFSARERATVSGASLLVANSAYTARRIADVHPWMSAIVPCELAREADADVSHAAGRPRDPVVLIVARMSATERYKGHDQLLEAWPRVVGRLPGAQLVIVGDGDDAARLRKKARDLGIGPSVQFTGFVSRAALKALYERSAVFAMPSRQEGFGLVYLEAMTHGMPCVGSVHDAAAHVVVDGKTGFLVDQGNLAELTDRLVRLLGDHDLQRQTGEAGRERVAARFSYPQFRDRFLSALDRAFPTEQRVPGLVRIGGESSVPASERDR